MEGSVPIDRSKSSCRMIDERGIERESCCGEGIEGGFVKILEEGLAAVAQMLGESRMKSQMEFGDLYLESAIETELH